MEAVNVIKESLERLTPEYLAGLFDGEGCIDSNFHRNGTSVPIRVSLAQKALFIMILLVLKFPKATLQSQKHILKNNKGTIDVFKFVFHGENAKDFLSMIKDHCIIKRPQVELALKFIEISYGFDANKLEKRREVAEQITQINRENKKYTPIDTNSVLIGGVQ